MSFFEHPLDDATVNTFFANMRRSAEMAPSRGSSNPIHYNPAHDVVRRAGPQTADLAREFYMRAKLKRPTSKQRNANLRRVHTALVRLADALETLRADRDLIVHDVPFLDPENLRRRAKRYLWPSDGPKLTGKGSRRDKAWAFAALVSIQAQAYERETGQLATARGEFLGRVRAEIEKVEQVQSNDALRKRVARALEKREVGTLRVIRPTSISPIRATR